MQHLRGYLTKRYNGLYLITAFKPKICEVIGANHLDAYCKHGDPLAYFNITPQFIDSLGILPIENKTESKKFTFYGNYKPTTHYIITDDKYDLYTIMSKYGNALVKNVCPWFIKKMFGIVTLQQPQPVYFQGEYNGIR